MSEEAHPSTAFDDVVHQRVRLGVLTLVNGSRRCEFGFLRDRLELTDGNLSRHLGVLEDAGYVAIEKGYDGKRPKTWVAATKTGTAALDAEVAALRRLLGEIEGAQPARRREHSR